MNKSFITSISIAAFTFGASSNNIHAQTFVDYREFIKASEGYKTHVYKDSRGFYTVGIGHKLLPEEIKDNKRFYTYEEVEVLFKADYNRALNIAKRVFPSFNDQPKEVKLILVSLSFNLGERGINKFTRFKEAIGKRDYNKASIELQDSLWYRQTDYRGKKYVNIIRNTK